LSRRNSAPSQSWHAIEALAALSALNSNAETGLTDDQARSRLSTYGLNKLRAEKRTSPIQIFFQQFANLLIAILLIATLISAFLGEIFDAIVIAAIVILVVILGFLQEYRAERALEALKKMLSPTCNVLRNGEPKQIPAEEVVPGDILLLETGDRVDADARLVEVSNLQLDEASLTGESVPVQKSTALLDQETGIADRVNMIFAGTVVTQGRARALVVNTGGRTEFGKIAAEVTTIKSEKTPLERRMSEIGERLGRICLILVSVIAIGGLIEEFSRTGTVGLEFVVRIFLFAVALAVAAVPEALPAIVTGSLAIGMRIMARRNALVRKMPAVETLGSTQVVCSDKTGTLTKGEMTVKRAFISGIVYDVEGSGYEPKGVITPKPTPRQVPSDQDLREFCLAAVLCSDATLRQEDDHWVIKGDTTEGALLTFADKASIAVNQLRNSNPRIGELPFTSERKRLVTVNAGPDGKAKAYMKGAPEIVLSLCSSQSESGNVRSLDDASRSRILHQNEEMAEHALRVLAVAERKLESVPTVVSEKIESNFTFLGLVGIIDPPRQDAIGAVAAAKAVGIKPIMITGDHKLTALAVARETGIYQDGDFVLTGAELDKLNDKEFEDTVERVTVYARVSPGHKLRIVDAWKKLGRVVAMTGDGVNDAPALKRADIGIAMGITGTEVTKEASDLVLADDNFATIVTAIELGRWIYENIKKYLAYLLQGNFVEIAVMTLASLLILPAIGLYGDDALPLLATQLLYINVVTDGLPAIAIGFSPPDPDLMTRPPRPKNESVFTKDVTRLIVMALLVQTPVLLLGFMLGLPEGLPAARSRLFLMFIGVELAIALNCRSLTHSVFEVKPHKWVIVAVISQVVLTAVLILIPITRLALGMIYPTTADLLWIIASAVETAISIELLKKLTKKWNRVPLESRGL
jgi:Ca2+-transporting ATPase